MPTYKVFIRPHAIQNDQDDYQVVVKPHPGGAVNRFGIPEKADAEAYAAELCERFGGEPIDETT